VSAAVLLGAPTRRLLRTMGTVISFDLRSPVAVGALEAACAQLCRADELFSTYRAASEISRLRRGELELGECAPEVREVLGQCAELAERSAGFFSAYPDGQLDPTGLVKGWAVERASDLLRAAGSTAHCINGAGDVQCVGAAAAGQPWRIGIAHPLRPGELVAVAVGRDLAVATSGTGERGAHILDPHERRPPSGLASVTVVGRRLGEVDALATAAFAMGRAAPDWLRELDGMHSFVVFADGSTWSSPGWAAA
jgi:thiamine biosynthesis lipoprotein